jgi:hypothetical protein
LGRRCDSPPDICAATAAVGDGATLQPGVDDRRDTALAQLFCHMASAKKDDVWNSIRCWTNEIVNERYRFTNTRNSVMRIVAVLGVALA